MTILSVKACVLYFKNWGQTFFEPIAPNLTAKWHAISISWYDMTSSFLKQSFFRRKGHNSPAKIKFPSSQTAKTVIKVISNSKKPFACFMLLKTTNYILESLKAHWLKWYPWLWQLQISFFMSPQYFFHFFPLLFSGCVTRPWQSKDKGKKGNLVDMNLKLDLLVHCNHQSVVCEAIMRLFKYKPTPATQGVSLISDCDQQEMYGSFSHFCTRTSNMGLQAQNVFFLFLVTLNMYTLLITHRQAIIQHQDIKLNIYHAKMHGRKYFADINVVWVWDYMLDFSKEFSYFATYKDEDSLKMCGKGWWQMLHFNDL